MRGTALVFGRHMSILLDYLTRESMSSRNNYDFIVGILIFSIFIKQHQTFEL